MALGWGRRCRDSEFLTGNRLSWRLTETEVEKTERKYHGTLCPNGEMPGSKVKQTAGVCVCTKKINLSGAYGIKQKQCTEARADVRSVCFRSRGFCLGRISSPCPFCLLCAGSPWLCPLPWNARSCSGLRFCAVSVTQSFML